MKNEKRKIQKKMSETLSKQLSGLSLENKDRCHTIIWSGVLYADYGNDCFVIVIKNTHYYEEVYFERGWHIIDDIKLNFFYSNILEGANMEYEDEPNILAWPYDFANNITIYHILSEGKLEDKGYINHPREDNIFTPGCDATIELWQDPVYNRWSRAPLAIQNCY